MGKQKIYHCSCFLFILLLFSCSLKDTIEDDTLSFNKVDVISKDRVPYDTPGNGWRLNEGSAKIDRTEFYKDKASLAICPDTSGKSDVSFLLETQEIDMNEVIFSGKYKVVSDIEGGNIIFSISYFDKGGITKNSISITPKDTLWSDFQVTSLVNNSSDRLSFDISTTDSIRFWISDCKVAIDNQPLTQIINKKYGADKDKEFDEGSRIDLKEELTPQMIENLEVLGRVWGFLKYYHPAVVEGKYNWDYELFRVLPQITNAKNKEERNKLLNKWIDRYGKIKTTTDYIIVDSSRYSHIINLDWINSEEFFDNKLIDKLNKIKNAKRSGKFNYYVVPHKRRFYDDDFDREKKYENIKWDDQGFRILTLFKLWNVIEYCFPYTHYTDIPWETLLEKFIPTFFTTESKSDYELTVLRLAAHINDSHGYVQIPDNDLKQTIVAPFFSPYKYKLPIELIQSTEGYIAVKSTNSPVFQRGDIICSINNICIDTLKAELQPYIISSTSKGFIRDLMHVLLLSETSHRAIGVLRNNKKIDIELTKPEEYHPEKCLKDHRRNILKNFNITYLNTLYSITEIDSLMQHSLKTKGLIIDMRDGITSMEPLIKIGDYLPFIDEGSYPLWISVNEKEYPGRFVHISQEGLKFKDSPKYKGKIAILVNENNQSAGETWATLYRHTNNSVIIGTQTSGANGNITSIYLPGKIKFTYSGLGAYYPHWEQLQRIGVKIDIPVYPTIQDIKEGRDVWIEKATEYIRF